MDGHTGEIGGYLKKYGRVLSDGQPFTGASYSIIG